MLANDHCGGPYCFLFFSFIPSTHPPSSIQWKINKPSFRGKLLLGGVEKKTFIFFPIRQTNATGHAQSSSSSTQTTTLYIWGRGVQTCHFHQTVNCFLFKYFHQNINFFLFFLSPTVQMLKKKIFVLTLKLC